MSASRDSFLSIPGNDPWDDEPPTGERTMTTQEQADFVLIHQKLDRLLAASIAYGSLGLWPDPDEEQLDAVVDELDAAIRFAAEK